MIKIKFIIALLITLFATQAMFSQGCEEPGEGDGINIFGYIQPQFEYNFYGKDGVFNKNADKSGFYFQRARLGVLGNIPYDFSYYFVMEFSPERGMGINDAFVTYNRFGPYLKVSMGLFKTPFGLEQMTGCHKLTSIYRSHVVDELAGPIRDMGIMLSGGTGEKKIFGLKAKNIFGYQFAIVNGEGRNTKDIDNRRSYIGRFTFHPFDFISIGTSYRYSNFKPLAEGTEKDDYGTRLGYELMLKYKGFKLSGEMISGSDVGTIKSGGGCSGLPVTYEEGSVDKSGYYFMASYKTPWNIEPVIKYESYDPNLDPKEGKEDAFSTMTFGMNYFFNEWTRLQVNYLYNAEEKEKRNDRLVIQVQAVIK